MYEFKHLHCVKSVRFRSYSGQHFHTFGMTPYSVRMRENANQNNSEYGHFSRSAAVPKSILFSKKYLNKWDNYRDGCLLLLYFIVSLLLLLFCFCFVFC